jgi:hypothetical protein
MLYHREQWPIMKAGTFEVLLFQAETKRMHKVQGCTNCCACSRDISGVLWYLWFKQNNMQCHAPLPYTANLSFAGNQHKVGELMHEQLIQLVKRNALL